MIRLKPDAEQIKAFLEELAAEDWVRRTERRWWPRFLFHYTDIRNAIHVLQDGYLYSRKYLENGGQLVVSSGSPVVLSGTNASIKDCVRLYFRPKTPTQYYAEGIHSQASLAASRFPQAHCPVPVFFLFDSAEILMREGCQFSDRGLASTNYQILSTAQELRQLPWTKIYHTGGIAANREIIARRMAEVIIPERLDLKALRFIYCRSDAEKDTLLFLLPVALRRRYQGKIVATTRSALFFRRQTFIEQASLFSDSVNLRFSPETKSLGPFHLKMVLKNTSGEMLATIEDGAFMLQSPYNCNLKLSGQENRYSIHFLLDDHLAYANSYEEIDIPF